MTFIYTLTTLSELKGASDLLWETLLWLQHSLRISARFKVVLFPKFGTWNVRRLNGFQFFFLYFAFHSPGKEPAVNPAFSWKGVFLGNLYMVELVQTQSESSVVVSIPIVVWNCIIDELSLNNYFLASRYFNRESQRETAKAGRNGEGKVRANTTLCFWYTAHSDWSMANCH